MVVADSLEQGPRAKECYVVDLSIMVHMGAFLFGMPNHDDCRDGFPICFQHRSLTGGTGLERGV